jgi:phage FluMu gp28-like protein
MKKALPKRQGLRGATSGKGVRKAVGDANDASLKLETSSLRDAAPVDPKAHNNTQPKALGVDLSHPEAAGGNAPMAFDNAFDAKRTPEQKAHAAAIVNEALIRFRPYQSPVFLDRTSGILILHWSRQIGKSFTLAAWAVDRLLSQLQRYDSWLITVLSNSRDNGAEFNVKAGEVCNKMGLLFTSEDHSPDVSYENMRMETRITVGNKVGRIKVLAANPRTARGFSGDLILDEFAFHEDSAAIWEAAEPILSSNKEFVCRIASTGNGKHNMFYRMTGSDGPKDGTLFTNAAGFRCSKVSRTEANKQGVKVYDPVTRKPISPDDARAKALDKRAYDQNYELQFADENMALLTHDLISAAERSLIKIDEQEWSATTLARLRDCNENLYAGQDFGRNRDLSVVVVGTKVGRLHRILGILRMSGMRSPAQQRQVDLLCAMPRFRRIEMDMTGNGLGLCEYLQEKWGRDKVRGVNFASSEPISDLILSEGRKGETARVTEIMATELVAVFEDRAIEIPEDREFHDDLRKPEKIVSPSGRVSIAATRNEAGHADHFWALCLFKRATGTATGPFVSQRIERPGLRKREHAGVLL